MLRAFALAALVVLPLAAFAHPVPADPHQGCLVVGFNNVPQPPPTTLVRGLLSYSEPKAPAASTINCQSSPHPIPPGGWSYTGNEWASHAVSCPPLVAAVGAVPGVYCGPMTSGTFTCRWEALTPPAPGTFVELVVASDVDLDGRITIVDKAATLASPSQMAPWVGEPLGPWTPASPFGGHFGIVNVAFPPGRIMAFPTSMTGPGLLDPSALFHIDCM